MEPTITSQCAISLLELPNELWIKVFAFLPHGDLQQVRLVCKRWTDLSRLPEFMEKSKFTINAENLTDIKTYLLKNYTANNETEELLRYPTMELTGLHSSEELQYVLRRVGRHVRRLVLQRAPIFESMHGNLPHLQELSLSYSLAECSNNPKAMDLNNFSQLRSLEVACNGVSRQIKARLLQQLTRDSTLIRLERLHLQHTSDHEELLLHVLETHASTLTHIQLYFFSPPTLSIGAWRHLFAQLCQLQTLKLSGNCRLDWLDAIFQSMPDEAPLRNLDLSGIVQVNDWLLALIVRKWPHTLQKLELMFCVQISDDGVRELKKLRDSLRVLNLSFCRNVSGRGLLEGLACERNNTLRRLFLNDLHQLDEHSVCVLAARLPNLDELSLENCSAAVTDKALAHVFRYQTRLQRLTLDDCIHISDEGLLGQKEETLSAMRRLNGLRRLSLRGCRNISNRVLMQGLQFSELRSLKLGYCHKISAVGIEDLVQHCPALEHLVISSCLMLDDDAVLHIAKGLRRLRRLNLSNCLKLTERAIDYIVMFCGSLQELTICGIDSLEVSDVQQRLLEVKPQLKELNL